ncbi:MAG: acetyl-CoA C-acetyltransferase [Nitrospinae bacterium]|nr:acetyl-CoA C-acetyltransferase [Nitrospinota bacterium]
MVEKKIMTSNNVFIVDGCRTPFLKHRGVPGSFTAADLAHDAGRSLFSRLSITPDQLDEVILGCVMPSPEEVNIARVVALRLGCGKKVPAWTVQRNCASGMQALDSAFMQIKHGRSNLVLAGGVEAMSHAPVMLKEKMVTLLGEWFKAKDFLSKVKLLASLRPGDLAPIFSLQKGLTDPIVGLNMGQTAENLAYRFNISRSEMDAFSLESHRRLADAIDKDYLEEIVPIYDSKGNVYLEDDGLRRETTIEKLSTLKPYFDRHFGSVTAGNSAQITDGAALLLLASEEAVKKYKLPVLGKIVDTAWAGVAPEEMGLGPVHAIVSLLKQRKIKPETIDYWEINEAFATQVLACVKALGNDDYCQEQFNMKKAFVNINSNRLNIDGGGVSIGHPVGASGARIVLHLLHVLKRTKAKRGVASLCIGGGQGGATLIERGGN